MTGKARSSLLSLAIIVVLVFGAFSPTIVYADDSKPPDTPPAEASSACTADGECPSNEGTAEAESKDVEIVTEESVEPTDTPAEVTAEATDTPAEVTAEATSTPDEAPVETGSQGDNSGEEIAASPATEEAAPTEEASAPASDSNILDQVPENTTVTVLDEQGQAQPLATQDSADAVAELDPIWCPAGQAPTPGTNGCTPSFNSFKALLKFLSGNPDYQGDGTIYIQEGVYISGGKNDLNAPEYDLSNIRNSSLTVTGGWDPTTNTINSGSTSTFRIPLLIGTSANPWGGSITINNLTIDKSDGTSIVIYTQGDITLSNVNITNAHNNGAGAELNAEGNININNSAFIRNKKAGAIIKAGGNVAIADTSFSNPTSGRQQITGLDIVSGGSVSLASVTANGNRQVGTNINAGGQVAIANSFFSGSKAFVGKGPSSGFTGYGLQVVTPDSIALTGVTANDNFLWGASLQAGGDVSIADSIFNANTTNAPHFIDDTGLLVNSGGNVSLNNVQANDNRLIGATIEASGDVSINNSTFTNNKGVTLSSGGMPTFHGYGLNVITQGNIFVNFVNASNNTLFGAHLEAGKDVVVSDSNFNNQTSGSAIDQTGRGLEIISGGNVFLSNVSLDNNQTFGANIQAGNGIVILDTVTATNNGADGVDVQGNCTTVYLGDGNYSNNGGYGLSVTNAALDQSSSSAVFANNGAGNIFQDPGNCNFPPPSNTNGGNGGGGIVSTPSNPASPSRTATQSASVQGTSRHKGKNVSFSVMNLSLKQLSLNDFLANSGTPGGHLSMFAGQYAYIYFDSELHIVTFSPFSGSLAMGGL